MKAKKRILMLFLALLSGCAHVDTRDLTEEGVFTSGVEGPAFNSRGELFAVNFGEQGTVGRVEPDGTGAVYLKLPSGGVGNSIQFDSRGEMLIADYVAHAVWKVDPKTRKLTQFAHEPQMSQPNDMAITRDNTLFLSDPDWDKSTGQLWKIDPKGKVTLIEKGMGTTNGIALSPDDHWLYVNESEQRKVWRYELDAQLTPINKTLFLQYAEGGLDGMKCDGAGNLYVCRHGMGVVAQYSPDGKPLREIRLRGSKGSNLVLRDGSGYVTVQDRGVVEVFAQ